MTTDTTDRPRYVNALSPVALVAALALAIGACVAWAHAAPEPGHRPFAPVQVWAARSGAVGLWAAAHAALFAIVMPALYRGRPIYTGFAALSGMTTIVATITWAALRLARP